MVNFLALLGWSPGDDREVMSTTELIESFTLEDISGGNAVFNTDKLDWMNAQYLAQMPLQQLADVVRPLLAAAAFDASPVVNDPVRFHRLLELLKPRAKRLPDFVDQARPLLAQTVEFEPAAVEKHLSLPEVADHLSALAEALGITSPFDEPHVENVVRGTATQRGLKAGQLIHAVRVALTGRTTSPGLFEVMVLLGPDETRARLARTVEFLAHQNPRIS
jgi:glutamyl/glutaminyl-tRNA synthetase